MRPVDENSDFRLLPVENKENSSPWEVVNSPGYLHPWTLGKGEDDRFFRADYHSRPGSLEVAEDEFSHVGDEFLERKEFRGLVFLFFKCQSSLSRHLQQKWTYLKYAFVF